MNFTCLNDVKCPHSRMKLKIKLWQIMCHFPKSNDNIHLGFKAANIVRISYSSQRKKRQEKGA